MSLERPLPGWDAQRLMMNYNRPKPEDIDQFDPDARKGAVLALLYPKDGEPHILLTLRHVYKGIHSGQVSFPGGSAEAGDQTLWGTALREAEEETGLDPDGVHLLRELTKVYIPPSRFLVTPFLAYCDTPPEMRADPFEVQRIIEAPFRFFTDTKNRLEKLMTIAGYNKEISVKYFDVDGETVWGATAMILSEIVTLAES